jgi:cation-dependent mannose-6-phosphate receptor
MKISIDTGIFALLYAVSFFSFANAIPSDHISAMRRSWDYGTSDIINPHKSAKGNDNKVSATEETEQEPTASFCSAVHPLTNGFFDLSDLSSVGKEGVIAWIAKGYDYNRNFTLGVCSSPLKPNVDLNNNFNGRNGAVLNSSEVGGYYTDEEGQRFSIGNFNSTPVFRGKKLTLTYHNGSYCPNGIDRKSTILSFTCDREILQKAQVSFVGVLHDCDYFFDVRTVDACPTAHKDEGLGVIWIFVFILLAALFVYTSGGFLYKRIVLNRRGWRQLPTYNLSNKVSSALSGHVSTG